MRRIFVAAAVVVLGSLVSVASPAQAAGGPWSSVSAGGQHTCAINTTKSLYCWGFNEVGEVGDGTSVNRPSPTGIGSAGVWASVSAGSYHTCAISTGKSLYCWGYNGYGQIGDGTIGDHRFAPKKIGTSGVWASVSAGGENSNGYSQTCAITTSNSLYCWGYNAYGQVGDGTTTPRLTPKKIGSTGVWASVTTGGFHTCATTTGKSLYCWGYNAYGQIGDGTSGSPGNDRHLPKKIGTSGVWAGVTAGDIHTCAITTSKSLYCWGFNGQGGIGDGTSGSPGNDRHSPKKIGTSGAFASVSSGGYHTCSVTTGNSLYCWGYNPFGQVGDGTSGTDRLSPRKIGTTGAWAGANGGLYHSCAITTGKVLYCWGDNTYGKLGDGTTDNRLSPKKIP